MASSVQVGSIEVKARDLVMETVDKDSEKPHPCCYQHVPCASDQVSSVLASVSTILNDHILYERMAERASLGKFQASIGSTNVMSSEYDRMLRYKRVNEYFSMDTFFATKTAGKSSRGNTCCQLFVTDKGYVYVVSIKSKSEVLQAVKQFAKEIGAPDAIISDASGEQTSKKQTSQSLRKFCAEIGTTMRHLEEGTQWANKAELYIGLIKEAVRKDMKESNCPLVFWDYCVERRARINNLTAKSIFKLHGSNAHTALTGEEGDISNLCQYKWYDWCYFLEHKAQFPHP